MQPSYSGVPLNAHLKIPSAVVHKRGTRNASVRPTGLRRLGGALWRMDFHTTHQGYGGCPTCCKVFTWSHPLNSQGFWECTRHKIKTGLVPPPPRPPPKKKKKRREKQSEGPGMQMNRSAMDQTRDGRKELQACTSSRRPGTEAPGKVSNPPQP